jgi:prohibitin 1
VKALYAIGGGVILIILFLMFCFRTVPVRQVGIITRFGTVNRIARPGVVVKLPWPIERLNKMDTSTQKEQQDSAAATKDLQNVSATLALNYAIDVDTAVSIFKTIGPDYKERIIVPTLQESFKSSSAKFTAQELVTQREAVKGQAYNVIRDRLQKYGIRVVDLNIVNFNFSPEYAKAIEDVQVANQKVAQARQELETTKVQAEKDIAAAQGAAEAQRLQQQTLTADLLQKMAIDKWDGKLPTTQAGQGTIFNIPVKQ